MVCDGEIVILGCGGSGGVPRAGNDWGKCDPSNPRNVRTRPSILIRTANSAVVIDTGPDFRAQMNRENVTRLDAVLFTHAHVDHVAGIDDIRSYWENQGLRKAGVEFPVYADKDTANTLKKRFDYLFMDIEYLYPKRLACTILTDDMMGKVVQITPDIAVIPYIQSHGSQGRSLGFRIGNVGYSTDMIDLGDQAIDILQGVDTWIADGGSFSLETSKVTVHANKDILERLTARIRPRITYLTHLSEYMDYNRVTAQLPENFALAHDGLVIPYQV